MSRARGRGARKAQAIFGQQHAFAFDRYQPRACCAAKPWASPSILPAALRNLVAVVPTRRAMHMPIQPSLLRRHRLKLALLLIAVGAAGLGLRWQQGSSVDVERIVQRDFVQSVVATGRVEAPHRVDVGAQITGTVLRVPVAEGQVVKRGDVLIELERRGRRRRPARQAADDLVTHRSHPTGGGDR